MMPYGDEFSRYPSMKGISLDLPFIKFRYVKVDTNEPEEAYPLRIADRSEHSDEGPSRSTQRVIYTSQAQVTTLGMDLMVSSASVIHELVYGRMESPEDAGQPRVGSYGLYGMEREFSAHSLDIIV